MPGKNFTIRHDSITYQHLIAIIKVTINTHDSTPGWQKILSSQKGEKKVQICYILAILYSSVCVTYCWNERSVESVVRKAKQKAGFSDAGIADQQQFEQQIIRLLRHYNMSTNSKPEHKIHRYYFGNKTVMLTIAWCGLTCYLTIPLNKCDISAGTNYKMCGTAELTLTDNPKPNPKNYWPYWTQSRVLSCAQHFYYTRQTLIFVLATSQHYDLQPR